MVVLEASSHAMHKLTLDTRACHMLRTSGVSNTWSRPWHRSLCQKLRAVSLNMTHLTCVGAERTMALLAFEDTRSSPVADLMDISQRQKTASELNAAILSSQCQVSAAPVLAPCSVPARLS